MRRSFVLVAASTVAAAALSLSSPAMAVTGNPHPVHPAVTASSNWFRIENEANGKCLTMGGATHRSLNAAVEQYHCNNSIQQYWTENNVGVGEWQIENENTLDCLSLRNNSTSSGTQVIQYTCNSENGFMDWVQIYSFDYNWIMSDAAVQWGMHPSGNSSANSAKIYINNPLNDGHSAEWEAQG